MVLHIEVNPFNQQLDMAEYCNEKDVQFERWTPLAEGRNNIFHNEVLTNWR
ncbi:hypothetical protein [uncultured Methanosphaera sp.]|uniref:hypothetical protein n=1 Tax=uncultured Methanosphaera sp. TaxID=262501 RepID=UPI0025DAC433|nr:hypothetical protein [uncultured Methanosphaera sp.]